MKAGELIAQLDAREIQAKLDQALAMREQATRDLSRARELMEKKITTQAEFDVKARERVAVGSVKETATTSATPSRSRPSTASSPANSPTSATSPRPANRSSKWKTRARCASRPTCPRRSSATWKLGAKLPVRVGAVPTQIEGTVVEMAPVADAASRTFLVKLDPPPTQAARSGQFGRVWIATGESRTIRVPAAAIVTRGQMETVFVAAKDHAQLRIVRTGKRTDGEVELLSGITTGESVVIEGAEQLRDGQPITLKP